MDTKTYDINAFSTLTQCAEHIHINFSSPQRTMSSAVLNGGLVKASHVLNKHVSADASCQQSPEQALQNYATQQGWQGRTVGMMTAAPMSTLGIARTNVDDVDIAVIVTTGLSNARRAGDKADVQTLLHTSTELGTINIVLICSAKLTEAAMVEALMIVTEAKVAALQNAKILSPISNELATGTGTDATVVVSGDGPKEVEYCGKHVLLGEIIGRLTIQALTSSLKDN